MLDVPVVDQCSILKSASGERSGTTGAGAGCARYAENYNNILVKLTEKEDEQALNNLKEQAWQAPPQSGQLV